MARLTRQSSRLRGSTPQTTAACQDDGRDSARRGQTRSSAATSLDGACDSPRPRAAAKTPTKTPTKNVAIVPESQEMHPAMFHSVKKLTSAKHIPVPSTPTGQHALASTVSASPLAAKAMTVPSKATFDFRHGSAELSDEAQKMMDELRAQAVRFKEELRAQDRDCESSDAAGTLDRKFAKPKGRAGRFSDVHMAAFKKMDSIANHASAFRAQSDRAASSLSSSSPKKSLKRSTSQAELDKVETTPARAGSRRVVTPRTEPSAPPVRSAKRVKQLDGSATAPESVSKCHVSRNRFTASSPSKPTASSSARMASLMTPTRSSQARNTDSNRNSKIPALARSGSGSGFASASAKRDASLLSSPTAKTLAMPQTENSSRFRNAVTSRLHNVKSILRRPQVKFSDDPVKISAGTHLATPSGRSAGRASSTSLHDPGTPSHRAEKHVNFSASTAAAAEDFLPTEQGTPTPAKKGASARAASMPGPSVSYPTLSLADQLPSSPTPATAFAKVQPRTTPKAKTGDFTFRSGGTISFSSPAKRSASTSVSTSTLTIRKVDDGSRDTVTTKTPQKLFDLATIPHGLSNKKRKRDGIADDDTVDQENSRPDSEAPSKKARLSPSKARFGTGVASLLPPPPPSSSPFKTKLLSSSPTKARLSSSPTKPKSSPSKRPMATPRSKGGSTLSMSRLSALARPKGQGIS